MKIRIIAGKLGGRYIDAPGGFVTHPMSERMRGALFNSLGDIVGKTVLDPFAGSGALSFEALSRGAAEAIALERDRQAQQVIARNIQQLGVGDRIQLIKANCRAWSEQNPNAQFDLVLCDPPYTDFKLSTVTLLAEHVKNNGLMILSYPGRESTPTVNGVVVVDNKNYGDAALAYYRPVPHTPDA